MTSSRADTSRRSPVAAATDRSPPQIAERVRESIRSGGLPPGAHLGAGELADRFGVSRGPVREALRLLESTGLVRIVPQKGAFVIALGDDEVREVLRLREVLFALLAEHCAARATAGDLADLEALLDRIAALATRADCTPRDFQRVTERFVAKMCRIAPMPRLTRALQDLSAGPAEIWGHLAVATRQARRIELRGYQQLFKAIGSGDGAAAFAGARRMHAAGVSRALELNRVTQATGGAPIELKRTRRRRTGA